MSDIPILLLLLVLAYCLFVGICVVLGKLIFPVIADDELETQKALRIRIRKRK